MASAGARGRLFQGGMVSICEMLWNQEAREGGRVSMRAEDNMPLEVKVREGVHWT